MADQDQQQQDQQQEHAPAAASTDKPAAVQKPEESPAKKTGRTVVIVGVLLLLICAALFFYYRSTFSENTDDAQVDGNIYQISSRIQGQVVAVHVEENTKVNKGDLLVEIDPKDYLVALEQAQAQMAQAKAGLAQAQADYKQATVNVPITSTTTNTQLSNSGVDVQTATTSVMQAQQQTAAAQARVDQARANALKASKDVERYTPLVEKDVISKQQYDAAVAQATASNAQVLEAENSLVAQQTSITMARQKVQTAENQAAQARKNGPQQVAAEQSRASAAAAQISSAEAQIKQAQARIDQANLNLQYTKVYAPSSGVVDKKNVVVGANLAAGQDLLSIVPLDDLWVTANFKETQLNQMHRCQAVDIEVDALGGRKFSGKLTQIGGATGSKLSLFPPENATGNYVKVVQRIPVRIDFTNLKQENGDYALRPGFSVTPVVTVKGSGDNQNTQSCEQGLPERQNANAH